METSALCAADMETRRTLFGLLEAARQNPIFGDVEARQPVLARETVESHYL